MQVWARAFHVTPEKLVQLVRQFGSSTGQIRDALKRAELARSGGRRS